MQSLISSWRGTPRDLPALLFAAAVLGLVTLSTGVVASAADGDPPLALVGGRVLTMTEQGELPDAVVLIEDGKIKAVGADVEIPEDADRIELNGMTVAPGLIDARSTLWLTPAASSDSANDGSLNVLDGVDLYSEDWMEAARHGITAVGVQPGSTGNLGGAGAVLRVAPATSLDELAIAKQAAVQASLGLGANSGTSRSRYSQYERVKRALDGAKTYQESWEKWEAYQEKKKEEKADDADEKDSDQEAEASRRPAGRGEGRGARGGGRRGGVGRGGIRGRRGFPPGRGGGPPGGRPTRNPAEASEDDKDSDSKSDDEKKEEKPPEKPQRDPVKDLLVKVLKGEVPLRIEVHRSGDALNALKLAEEFEDLRLVMEGLSNLNQDAWSKISQSRWPLVLGPILEVDATPEYRQRRASDWLKDVLQYEGLMAAATFSSSSRGSNWLRAHAGAAVAAGMDPETALAAITSDAARILGVEDRLGKIQPGMQADVTVFAGEPLDASAPVRLTVSAGQITYQNDALDASPAPSTLDRLAVADTLAQWPKVMPQQYAVTSQNMMRPDGSLGPGVLVIASGKVVSAEQSTGQPSGMPVFDVGEAVVTPGLASVVAIGQANLIGSDAAADAGHLRAVDAFDPLDRTWKKLLHGGFTTAVAVPAPRNVISGQIGCLRIGAEQPVGSPSVGALLALSRQARQEERYPASLMGQVDLLQNWLSGKSSEFKLYAPQRVRELLQAEQQRVAERVSEGESVAVLHAQTASEIRSALQLIERESLKACLMSPKDFHDHLDAIGQQRTPLIIDTFGTSDYAWFAEDCVQAAARGASLALTGQEPQQLRWTAAMLVQAGLSPDDAMQMLTGNLGSIFQMQQMGRLEPGAPADVVVWDGSPLDLSTRPLKVLVGGRSWEETP